MNLNNLKIIYAQLNTTETKLMSIQFVEKIFFRKIKKLCYRLPILLVFERHQS